jgi:flagellin-specific chaperone FliS
MESEIHLTLSADVSINVERVDRMRSPTSIFERVSQIFTRLRQSLDRNYIEIKTPETLYRVSVERLREAAASCPEGVGPKSPGKRDLKQWLEGRLGVVKEPRRARAKRAFASALSPERLQECLGITEKEEAKQIVVNLYFFLTKKGRHGINQEKLSKLDNGELEKLVDALYDEFKEGTKRGNNLFMVFPQKVDEDITELESVLKRVRDYRACMVENLREFFSQKYPSRLMETSTHEVLVGQANPSLEREFVDWYLKNSG